MDLPGDLLDLQLPGFYEVPLDVAPEVRREVAVRGQIAILRADHQPLPFPGLLRLESSQRPADGPLRFLEPVVDGRVDYVDRARGDRLIDRLFDQTVGLRVRLPEVGAHTQGREAQGIEGPEVP